MPEADARSAWWGKCQEQWTEQATQCCIGYKAKTETGGSTPTVAHPRVALEEPECVVVAETTEWRPTSSTGLRPEWATDRT